MSKYSTNPFITSATSEAAIASLVEQGLAHSRLTANGNWICEYEKIDTEIGYNRGWLVVRYEWLKANEPAKLIPAKAMMAKATLEAAKNGNSQGYDAVRSVLGPIVAEHKDSMQLSWGEISVRLGLPEGMVRKAYRALDAKKDRGVRNGKGGRWLFNDGTLYQDNRKREGAWIPTEVVGKPKVEQLLNFVPKAGPAKATPKPRTPKVTTKVAPTPNPDGLTSAQRKAARKAERAEAAKAS